MPKTRAQQNRAIRQEAVREQLATYGLITQVLNIAEKLAEPKEWTSTEISALKSSADIKLRLVDKYLPNLQSVEKTVEKTITRARDLNDDYLADIATGSGAGITEQAEGSKTIQ